MTAAPKFCNGSHDLTTPLSGTVSSSIGCDLHIQPVHQIVVFAISSPITKMHKAMQNVEIEVI